MPVTEQFWKNKTLLEMSTEEREALCDGCARCCLHKLWDEAEKKVYYTNIACHYLDIQSCRCTVYENRAEHASICANLWQRDMAEFSWMPDSCAYRRIYEGRDLPAWHPLLTGNPDSARDAGMSIRNYAITEQEAGPLENHIIG